MQLGGDRPIESEGHAEIIRAMAAGVSEGDGGQHLRTWHPQGGQSSSQYFHKEDWLDFNMFQNGHCRDQTIYDKNQGAYNRIPAKPFIDGEPIYEDHPVCFNANDLGTSNAYDVRKYAYVDLFSGAFGHTYGCHDIWQFYSKDFEAVNGPHLNWTQALDLPGANQMKFLRNLMESYPLNERVPDQSLILENDLPASDRIQATRGKDYIFVYTATGRSFTLLLGKTDGNLLNMYWFNPRNGISMKEPQIKNSGKILLTPPTSGYGQDWILIMDDAEKNYSLK